MQIPLIAAPNQELNIVLGGQNCTIQVRQIGDFLYFSLWVDADLIIQNAVILPRQFVLQYNLNRFSGNFMILDDRDKDQRTVPHYSGLADRFALYYVTADEIEAVKAMTGADL